MRTANTDRHFANPEHHAIHSALFVTVLSLAVLAGPALAETGAPVHLEWDAVADPRVDHYQVHYGLASGQYDHQVQTPATGIEIASLDAGTTYYFAARACNQAETECSDFSNELQTNIAYAAPVADLSASVVTGVAPLTVTFADQSAGTIAERSWNFGDGGTSSATTAVYSYTQPGIYSVTLTVTGPGGTDEEIKTDLIVVAAPPVVLPPSPDDTTVGALPDPDATDSQPLKEIPVEFGTLDIDHTWQRFDFQRSFNDPVVVVKSLSTNDSAAAVIRLDAIDANGFWIRVQEWDYLDGLHATETASYLVMERGRHQLPDGAWVEAGSLETSATEALDDHAFSAPFDTVPVVFAAVASVIEEDAVIAQLSAIGPAGFQIGLREQEANAQIHLAERIDYIAWEASSGEIGGLRYTVGHTGSKVGSKGYRLNYTTAFDQAPVLLADLQTATDKDTASLRLSMQTNQRAVLKVQEEQSKDRETNHANEDAGYFIADAAE